MSAISTRAIWTFLVLLPLFGCEGGREEFLACPLDPFVVEQTDVCRKVATSAPTAQKSCVVTQHPQCPDDVCVSWEGSAGFCTFPCKTDADCPADSGCFLYQTKADAQGQKVETRYCIKDSARTCSATVSCPSDMKCVDAACRIK